MSTTESSSRYNDLEKMNIGELLRNISNEDMAVPLAVQKVIPQIEKLVSEIVPRIKKGGRLFYVGAGTSGRLGVLDASECPPTFGVSQDVIIGIIAGGDPALKRAVEFAEDDKEKAWEDLSPYNPTKNDIVIGLSASGTTPYVVGVLEICKTYNIKTGCIVCNRNTLIGSLADFPVECIVGPEFVTGSTRMKAGTAQKLILNMVSTAIMIQLGRIKDNKMVDMQLSNNKLVGRGIKILMEELKVDMNEAKRLLTEHGNVRKAIEWYKSNA